MNRKLSTEISIGCAAWNCSLKEDKRAASLSGGGKHIVFVRIKLPFKEESGDFIALISIFLIFVKILMDDQGTGFGPLFQIFFPLPNFAFVMKYTSCLSS